MGGHYDGWLLSTANGFAPQLRSTADLAEAGRHAEARSASRRLSELVRSLFDLTDGLPTGNPFANANRAVDHLFALGTFWRNGLPVVLSTGHRLPDAFLSKVETLLHTYEMMPEQGYWQG